MLSRNGENMSQSNMNLPTLAKICDGNKKSHESGFESQLQHKQELPPVNSLLEKCRSVSSGYSAGSNVKIRNTMSGEHSHSINLPSFKNEVQGQQPNNVHIKFPNNMDQRGFQSSLLYHEPRRPTSIVVPMVVPVLMRFNTDSVSSDGNICPTYMIPPTGNERAGVDGMLNPYPNLLPEMTHPYSMHPTNTGLTSMMSTSSGPKALHNFAHSPKGSNVLLNQPLSYPGPQEYFYTPVNNTFGGRNPPIITENNVQGLCRPNADQIHSSDDKRHMFTSNIPTCAPGDSMATKPRAEISTYGINEDSSKMVPDNQHGSTHIDQGEFMESDHLISASYMDSGSNKSSIQRRTCPVCKKLCSRPSTLKTHLLIHSGALPHKCPFSNCHRRFNVKSNLTRHIRSRHKFDKS